MSGRRVLKEWDLGWEGGEVAYAGQRKAPQPSQQNPGGSSTYHTAVRLDHDTDPPIINLNILVQLPESLIHHPTCQHPPQPRESPTHFRHNAR